MPSKKVSPHTVHSFKKGHKKPQSTLLYPKKLTEIHAVLYEYTPDVTENDMIAFIKLDFYRVGSDTAITPREVIRDYLGLLTIIHQNPGTDIQYLM